MMFKRKQKDQKNIIEFNLLEKAINEKASELINTNVLDIIDAKIALLTEEINTEFKKLQKMVEPKIMPEHCPPEQSRTPKYDWEIKRILNDQVNSFEIFSSKLITLNYLKDIRADIYLAMIKKGFKAKQ